MSRQSLHRWSILTLLVICLALLGGCAQKPEAEPEVTVPAPEATEDVLSEVPEIDPNAQPSQAEYRSVALYFRMNGEDLLASETRSVRFPIDQQVEHVMIQQLAAGPSQSLLELTGVFGQGAGVSKVWRSGDTLTVQLNHEFLSVPIEAPIAWLNDPEWSHDILTRRQLTLMSIVNTLTEATNYAAIQFVVLDTEQTETGRRLFRSEIYEGGAEDVLLEPVRRDESYLLTHYTTADIIFSSWQDQTFDRMYRFVAQGSDRPTEAAFLSGIHALDRTLMQYTLTPGVVSDDGQSATMVAEYVYLTKGEPVSIKRFPVRMIREAGIWKISYADLIRLMEGV